MKTYYERTIKEQELIRKTYKFEKEACDAGSSEPNPYTPKLLALEDGEALFEAINVALEMEYGNKA